MRPASTAARAVCTAGAEHGVGRAAERDARAAAAASSNGPRLGERRGERLLAVDVLAGGERGERDLGVGGRDREVEDRVDLGVGVELGDGDGPGARDPRRHGDGTLVIEVGHRDERARPTASASVSRYGPRDDAERRRSRSGVHARAAHSMPALDDRAHVRRPAATSRLWPGVRDEDPAVAPQSRPHRRRHDRPVPRMVRLHRMRRGGEHVVEVVVQHPVLLGRQRRSRRSRP